MDFGLTDEQRLTLDTVDRFMARHLPPEETRRRDRAHEPPYQLLPLMGEAGFLGIPFPEELGGLARPWTDVALVLERLGKLGLPAASLYARTVSFGGMSLMTYGTEAQRRELMPRMIRGELLFSFGLTEPGSGSDAASIQTRAVKADGGWRITGRKVWISDADKADYMVACCRTGAPDSGKRGISVFLVPRRSEGLSMTQLPKVGHNCMPSWDVGFDEVFVPDSALMGEVNRGMYHLQATLQYARAGQAASAVGQAQAALDLAVAHAKDRHQFGQPIGKFQAIQQMLADCRMRIDMARLLLYKLCWLIDTGQDARIVSAQAKLAAAETFSHVAERGMQVLASAGYSLDSDMQRYWRDSRLYMFGEGSIEVMRGLIARDMGL